VLQEKHAMHTNPPGLAVLAALLAIVASSGGWSQSRPPVISIVDVRVPSPPIPVRIAGARHLVYELHVTNFRRSEITLTRLEVLDADRGTRLGEFRDADLDQLLGRPGAAVDSDQKRAIAAGMRAVVYLSLVLDAAVPTPMKLQHRLEFDMIQASDRVHVLVDAGASPVASRRPIVLNPPLKAGPWVALYDPAMAGGHRTAIYAVNGRARIPARFAIDWVRLESDGTHARGDETQVANWHGYAADVLAVADGTIVEARDDITESPSLSRGSQSPIPLENVSGNFVCLALGGEQYAFYEHLKPGSLRVRAGERVRSGQVLGSLGNSGGSSSGPHLHFHVADAPSELASEGLPYVFRRFDVLGAFERIDAFAAGAPWQSAPAEGRGQRINELPAPNTVILFPAATPSPRHP
jgi:murein DD-endopeptidase